MSKHDAAIGFRADTEGRCAISVLGVVLFHSGLSVADGGFVGVDGFFVVSGFLITSLLMKEVEVPVTFAKPCLMASSSTMTRPT